MWRQTITISFLREFHNLGFSILLLIQHINRDFYLPWSFLQPGADEFFEHPPVGSPRSGLGPEKAGAFCTVPKQSLEMGKSVPNMSVALESASNQGLGGNEKVTLSSSIENLRSLSPGEDEHSFYRLVPDDATGKDAFRMTESLNDVSSREENLCFVELPSASAERKQENVTALSVCTSRTEGEQSSPRTDMMLSWPQEVDSRISTSLLENSELQSSCELNAVQPPDQNAWLFKSSDSHLSQALPVWVSVLF